MKIRAMGSAALVAATLMTTEAVHAAGGSFVCKGTSTTKEVASQVDGGFNLQNIVKLYAIRWDAKEARRLCEAYAAGEPVEISCLDGRRDWDAIMASVPGEYFGMSDRSLAEPFWKLSSENDGFRDALAYCRSVGAIK